MEDWTVPGIIDDEAAQAFGTEALKWDARKVSWNGLDQFNVCDPAKTTVPTLVIHGFLSYRTQKNLSLLERYAVEFVTATEDKRVATSSADA